MARTFTLAQLRTKVRERADQENSGFIDDTELNGYISSSYTRLYDILVKSGLHYFETTQTIVADGSDNYALPADYYGTLGVDFIESTDVFIEVPEYMFHERNDFGTSGSSHALGYRIIGTVIELLPKPTTGSYRHIYLPAAVDLTTDSQTVDGVSGWEEFIVLDSAIKCYIKEEAASGPLDREREVIRREIQEAAENRAMQQPRVVADTRDRRLLSRHSGFFQLHRRGGGF